MALSTLVKISGVNNLSDARFCAGMGASILGFCPEANHPDFIDLKKYREITAWIKGVKLAGEFHSSSFQRIKETDSEYNFDFLQVSDPGIVKDLNDYGKPLIYSIDIAGIDGTSHIKEILELTKQEVVYFVFEGNVKDHEKIEKIHQWSEKYPILFGGEVNRDYINELLNKFHYCGISLKGGSEIKPGYYDFGNLSEILEYLDVDS